MVEEPGWTREVVLPIGERVVGQRLLPVSTRSEKLLDRLLGQIGLNGLDTASCKCEKARPVAAQMHACPKEENQC